MSGDEGAGWLRRHRADLFVYAACVLALVWSVEGQAEAWSVTPSWWRPVDLVGGALAIVGLAWRRRHPVWVALVLGVGCGLFVSAMVPILVSVWTVASRRPLRVALAVSAAHLAVAIPYYLLFPVVPEGWLAWSAVLVLMYVVAVSAGVAVRSRRQVIAGLLAAAERDRHDYGLRLASVRRTERARIAREMHDVLAHRMSLLSMHAGALEYRTTRGAGAPRLTDDELHRSVSVIRDAAHLALEELGEVLAVLRDEDTAPRPREPAPDADPDPDPDPDLRTGPPQPVIADLPRLVAEADAAGQPVRLRIPVDLEPLDGLRRQAHRTIYRAVQEGLTNARKHAPGAAVDVTVTATPGRTVAAVLSNPLPLGVGADEVLRRPGVPGSGIPGSGTGLTGLRERVRIDGGDLRADVRDGTFELAVELPWRS